LDKITCFEAKITLDGPDAGQTIDVSDEELAAKQEITVEKLKDVQAKLLAKVYALILSWPDPASNKTEEVGNS
jgi:hypothetical protein